jgi:hypothetical protein
VCSVVEQLQVRRAVVQERTHGNSTLVGSCCRNLLLPLAQRMDGLKSQGPCGAGLWTSIRKVQG